MYKDSKMLIKIYFGLLIDIWILFFFVFYYFLYFIIFKNFFFNYLIKILFIL